MNLKSFILVRSPTDSLFSAPPVSSSSSSSYTSHKHSKMLWSLPSLKKKKLYTCPLGTCCIPLLSFIVNLQKRDARCLYTLPPSPVTPVLSLIYSKLASSSQLHQRALTKGTMGFHVSKSRGYILVPTHMAFWKLLPFS